MKIASLFFNVKAQGHTINIVVVVRKDTLLSVKLGLTISIHILILNLKRKIIFCQGKRSNLKASL